MLDTCFNTNDLHTLASMFEFARKPRWVYNYSRDNGRGLANPDETQSSIDVAGFLPFMTNLQERHLTWEHAQEMISYWGGPIYTGWGQAGSERCLEIFKSELLRDMALTGCASVADITPTVVRDRLTTTHNTIGRYK
jgi:isopentenyl diphosphate isomerase/L-lactate dehydrogenase-like FMN-dependent dehydrogenase